MDVRFGTYLLKVRERRLFGPDGSIDLDGRSVDVLRALLVKPNELVMKDEIFSAVWPDVAVGENTLPVHISALRKALGPQLIETVHGRGYKYRGPQPEYISNTVAGGPDASGRPVIAVLTFRSGGIDPDLASLGESVTGEIIERLSRFPLYVVHPRTQGITGGAGQPQGTRQADFVLTGDVRRSGPRLRVAAKLLAWQSDVVIWAEHYDRSGEDLFDLLDEIAGTMAGRLNSRIESHMATRQLEGRSTTSYDHLVRGIWHFRLQSVEAPLIAEQLFRKARDIDTGNAEAIRWLSMSMTCRWLNGCRRDALLEGLALGRAAAELDPASATCHAAHGFAQLWAEGVELADMSFRQAYAANPNDGYMLADVGLCNLYAGRLGEAYAVLERAQQLNPFPTDWHSQYRSMALFAEGRYAEAVPGLQRLPLGAFGLVYLAACHGHLGNRQALQALLTRLRELDCDLLQRAEAEPHADRSVNQRLADGLRQAMSIAAFEPAQS